MSIIAWMIGSSIGRAITSAVLGLGVVGLLVWSIFRKGAESEKLKQAAKNLKQLNDRIKTDEDIARMPPSERRDRLREWAG